jgi:hypothetical protein
MGRGRVSGRTRCHMVLCIVQAKVGSAAGKVLREV